MSKPQKLIDREDIEKTVKRIASEISNDFKGKNPLFIGVLTGAFVFLSDLIRQLDFNLEIEFIRLSSYGNKTETSGKVNKVLGLKCEIKNRNLIVVEDIVDTGYTTSFLLDWLKKKKPTSLKLCALTHKPARCKVPIKIDYLGFTIPDKFIVGYGIDFNGQYRNLPDICFIENVE
ncbi:MAG: hypoxanthine phosphoribosyltransferase [Promethearchaeota archaeon]|nr:MAG: hypoxanthine phosphoribosyltransferase [Candidatus Lokiarchaeota archaeon]